MALFFTMGVMLFANQTALDRFVGSIKYHLIPFLVCVCILIPLIEAVRLKAPPELLLQNLALYTGVEAEVSLIGSFALQNPFNFTGMNASFDWYLMNILRAYTAWCGVFLFIALLKNSFQRNRHFSRYAADSAYFIYLIHFPIQLIMSEYLRDSNESSIGCFWICLLGSTALCVVLYHLMCRATPIGTLLSGRRYSLSVTESGTNARRCLKKIGSTWAGCDHDRFYRGGSSGEPNGAKVAFFGSHTEPENIKEYISGKSAEQLESVTRSGGRNAMHMVAYNMPVARPDEKIAESVQLLLDAGLDPMSRDDFGQTPLHYAVRNGNTVTLGLLLKAGADPNAKDTEYGSTPLHLAATLKADDLIRDLVAAGADPGWHGKMGKCRNRFMKNIILNPFLRSNHSRPFK